MQNIFKAYDIRGVYPSEIDEEKAYRIARAAVRFLKAKTLAVGRDARASSPSLFSAVSRGVTDEGCAVIDLGLVSTPMLYFASGTLPVEGALMITASHNPPEYNGIKVCRANAVPVGEDSGLGDIRAIAEGELGEATQKKGTITKQDIHEKYADFVASHANFGEKKFTVVVDCAAAMGVLELPVYKKFPENIRLITLYGDLDRPFSAHEANPVKTETISELRKRVVSEKADLGVAYDGDADRIGFVDERGEVIPMDAMTGILAKTVLEKHPGARILYDLRSTRAVKEVIEEAGGVAAECRVGHAFIKKQMRSEGAVFAGELSGHYYFKENFNGESSTLAAVLLLNRMAKEKKTASELAGDLKRYFHSGEINSEVADANKVFSSLKEKYADGTLNEMDGVKISYGDWWFSVRASNTEPVIRLNLEANTKEVMEEKRDELLKIIRGTKMA